MIKDVLLGKHSFTFTKYLPFLLLFIVFTPDSLSVLKILGVVFALILFYRSVESDKTLSSGDLHK